MMNCMMLPFSRRKTTSHNALECTENALLLVQIQNGLEQNHSLDGNGHDASDRRVGCVANHVARGRAVTEQL